MPPWVRVGTASTPSTRCCGQGSEEPGEVCGLEKWRLRCRRLVSRETGHEGWVEEGQRLRSLPLPPRIQQRSFGTGLVFYKEIKKTVIYPATQACRARTVLLPVRAE